MPTTFCTPSENSISFNIMNVEACSETSYNLFNENRTEIAFIRCKLKIKSSSLWAPSKMQRNVCSTCILGMESNLIPLCCVHCSSNVAVVACKVKCHAGAVQLATYTYTGNFIEKLWFCTRDKREYPLFVMSWIMMSSLETLEYAVCKFFERYICVLQTCFLRIYNSIFRIVFEWRTPFATYNVDEYVCLHSYEHNCHAHLSPSTVWNFRICSFSQYYYLSFNSLFEHLTFTDATVTGDWSTSCSLRK